MMYLATPASQRKKSLQDDTQSTSETTTSDAIITGNASSPLSFMNNTTSEKAAGKTSKLPALLCIAIVVCAAYQCAMQGATTAGFLKETFRGGLFLQTAVIFLALSCMEIIWRAVLVFRYKPVQGCEDELLPDCAVVVPAFNEGKQVFVTLQSLAASNYPKDKLKLIAIDDGSVDDTWIWIQKAKEVLGDRVIVIKLPRNKGKRHALYAGFQQSTEEILVTVDSDSIVEANTLRNLVTPFVLDKKVGAVAGNVRVLNRDKGVIPRMLDVAFVYSFDFIRASQSMVKAVMCTPGALSAYRRSVVMNILPEWLHQTFWGQPANIGEDRAITNLILREGYHILFQQNSKVYTEVPVTYSNLCKMYLRWARSDVRETIAMTRFIFKPFRDESMLGARINLFSSWVAVTKGPIFFMIACGLSILHPAVFGVNTALGVIITSSLTAIIYAWKFRTFASLWAFMYGFFFFISLSWIGLYALITLHKGGWLTRQIKTKSFVDQEPQFSANKIFIQEAGTADGRYFDAA